MENHDHKEYVKDIAQLYNKVVERDIEVPPFTDEDIIEAHHELDKDK